MTSSSAPDQILECERTALDVQLVDKNGSPFTSQVWLNVITDPHTRMPMAWRLTLKGNSTKRGAWSRESPSDVDGDAASYAKHIALMLRELADQATAPAMSLRLDRSERT